MKVEVFGRVAIENETQRWERFPTARCREVIAFLALSNGKSVPRTWLIENVWPGVDPDHCRNRLSVTLSMLRSMLGESHSSLLVTDRDSLRLANEVENEFEKFWSSVNAYRHAESDDEKRIAIHHAVSCYRAPLLIELKQEWAVLARQEALQATKECLEWLARRDGDHGLAKRAEMGCLTGAQLARAEGFEPPTPSSEDWCSIH